ncbi:MAG: SIS domain-containing protein, partial [Firmicutes bacterium]|nr:SIS domain-containing protein [Bacillota bacterium]
LMLSALWLFAVQAAGTQSAVPQAEAQTAPSQAAGQDFRTDKDGLYEWAGPEIAVATTKGFTTQLVLLYLFALYAAKKLDRVDDFEYARLLGEICSLPKRIQNAFDLNMVSIPRLAEKYHDRGSMFFIGRNTDYAVALEGSLKMKEISYIHAEAYAAGELKHGTIALIEEGTPVVAVCCNEDLLEKTASNILEVKARGAEVLALSFRENRDIIAHADDVMFVPKTETFFSEAVAVIPLQLLAYYVAKANGCDIDKPRNLAKSVTVE